MFATSIHTERNGEVCDGPTVRPAGWDPEGPLSERTPLLPDQPRPRQAPPKPATTPSKARRRIFVLICISIVAADFGALLSYAPQLEILEELAVRLICWWHAILPTRAIWLAPLFQTMGGGPQVATSMAYAIVTDLFPASDRANIFFIIGAAIIIGEILAGPLSALMILWTPWLPMSLGLLLQVGAFMAAASILETMPGQTTTRVLVDEHGRKMAVSALKSLESTDRSWRHVRWWKKQWESLRHGSLMRIDVLCVLGSFLMASVGRQALQLIVQYASKRFSWSIAGASLVINFKALVNLVALALLLPWLSSVLSRRMPAATMVLSAGQKWFEFPYEIFGQFFPYVLLSSMLPDWFSHTYLDWKIV